MMNLINLTFETKLFTRVNYVNTLKFQCRLLRVGRRKENAQVPSIYLNKYQGKFDIKIIQK